METSGYVSDLTNNENELGLGPKNLDKIEEKELETIDKKPSFFEKLNTTLSAIDKGADTVNKVIDTGKKATTPVQVPEGAQPGQGFDIKTLGWLAAGGGVLYGIVKMVTSKK